MSDLLFTANNLVEDRDDAKDIAQEAFIKVYDPTKSRFSTWLYRIATNFAVNYLRRRKATVSINDIETIVAVLLEQFN